MVLKQRIAGNQYEVFKIIRNVVKGIMHVVPATGLLIIFLLPVNKYSWMQEMDPSVTVESASSNAMIFSLILLVLISFLQLLVVINSKKMSEKGVSISLVILAIIIWVTRFKLI